MTPCESKVRGGSDTHPEQQLLVGLALSDAALLLQRARLKKRCYLVSNQPMVHKWAENPTGLDIGHRQDYDESYLLLLGDDDA